MDSGDSGLEVPVGEGSRGDLVSVADAAGSFRGGVVTARGTAEGLVIRLDGRVEQENLRGALRDFMETRRSFLTGNEVAFEWVGSRPEESFVRELSDMLTSSYDIVVRASRVRERDVRATRQPLAEVRPRELSARKVEVEGPARSVSLFDGIEALGLGESAADAEPGEGRSATAENAALWDDPDARMVYGTVRSGQKIETEHSVVVFGDVNSGGEIVAGGDIVVLGALRGIAHAGAYDETGGGRVIFGLNIQPTQLRIGAVISRGSSSNSSRGVAEVARVEGSLIVVEPYQAKASLRRR